MRETKHFDASFENKETSQKETVVPGNVYHTYVIEKITPGSAADVAGLVKGDHILSVNGQAVDMQNLNWMISLVGAEPLILDVCTSTGEKRTVVVQPKWDETSEAWKIGYVYYAKTLYTVEHEQTESAIHLEVPVFVGNAPERGVFADVVLGKQETVDGKKRRALLKYALMYEDTAGERKEYDVLEHHNSDNVPVYLDEGSNQNIGGHYSDIKKECSLRRIDDRLFVHALLHELRHAEQYRTGMFDTIEGLYGATSDPSYGDAGFQIREKELVIKNVETILRYMVRDETIADDVVAVAQKNLQAAYDRIDSAQTALFREQSALREGEKTASLGQHEFERNMYKERFFPLFKKSFEHIQATYFSDKSFNPFTDIEKSTPRIQQVLGLLVKNFTPSDDPFVNLLQYQDIGLAVQSALSGKTGMGQCDWQDIRIDPSGQVEIPIVGGVSSVILLVHISPDEVASFEQQKQEVQEESKTKWNDLYTKNVTERTEKVKRLEQEFTLAKNALPTTRIIDPLSLVDVLRLPTLLMERDAEFGALKGLRQIKERTGVNLLQPVQPPPPHEELLEEGISLQDWLRHEVESLNAVHGYMQDIGVPLDCVRTFRRDIGKKKKRIPKKHERI
ncbi:MAG: PDZ domain-containing protein [Candidatus Magasanikbacteria bacterium]|nr:PDZ domain-containing protein [Candidatus Magasanikbacteria bacterium]